MLDVPARQLLDPSFIARLPTLEGGFPKSVLMFSGGRDSSIAALRLHERSMAPVLVTIVSGHLRGIERVRKRVQEMEHYLHSGMPWVAIRQPTELRTDTSFYEQTCLPCHHAYVVAGAAVAAKVGIAKLAFGYAGYQKLWPEQTPLAIERLTSVLDRHGIELVVPAYNLLSKHEAVEELAARGLSTEALEQKCIQQVTNVELAPGALARQIGLWERAIDESMLALSTIEMEVVEVSWADRQ